MIQNVSNDLKNTCYALPLFLTIKINSVEEDSVRSNPNAGADFEPHVQISVQAFDSLSATWSTDEIRRETRIALDRIDLCKWWLCKIDDSEQFMSVSTVFQNGCHWYRYDDFDRTNPCCTDNHQECFTSFSISLLSASCCSSRQSCDMSNRIDLSLSSRSLSVKIRE